MGITLKTHKKTGQKAFFPSIILCIALTLSGCKNEKDDKYEEKPVTDLYKKATTELKDKNFKIAAKNYEEVIRQHPYSNYAMQAHIMAAYAHYRAMAYEDAVASVDAFIQLYPNNKHVPYAYYLKALCYYNQISSIERDQRITESAEYALQELMRRFPYSPYAKDARLKLDLTREHIAGGNMEIGRFYQRQKLPIAALGRFQEVVKRYDRSTHTPEALYRLVELNLFLGIVKEAQASAAVLGHNYPKNKWYQKAYKLLEDTNQLPESNNKIKLSKTWGKS